MKNDYYSKFESLTLDKLKKTKEYKRIPAHLNKSKLNKKQLVKLLTIIAIAKEKALSSKSRGGSDSCSMSILKKYTKIVKPTRKLYHGRNVTKNAGVWESNKDFKRIMWWALERVTPLMYASTSIKGRSLDKFYRWDVYEARVAKNTRFLLITKESIQYLLSLPKITRLQCEGNTVGKWLKKAFPIIKGRLKRRSYIDSDRKMASCLCYHIDCSGYIADEIPVVDGPGALHKEIMVCVPEKTLKLKKYMGFSTNKGQTNVEQYLNEKTTKLRPDIIKIF